jgi:hypothetical protein
VLVLAVAALLATAASASAVTRIPHRCQTAPAERLCAIHFHHARANHFRSLLGLSKLPYRWVAEAHPARRGRILTYWTAVHAQAKHRYEARPRAPWSDGWYRGAMCVHSREGSWTSNTGNGYYGGMQFSSSSWLSNGGGQYASRADLASPFEQLMVAYHYWRSSGWGPWPNTAAACGLL